MTEIVDGVELSVVLADDESLARRRVMELLRGRAGVRVIAQCATGPSTLAAVRELRPDLLFLDVQMPGLTGFEVLARLRPVERPIVVFSTAYDEYALAAFEVHAVDYLLKPYSDERFQESLGRAERALRDRRVSDLHDRLRGLLDEVAAGLDAVPPLERYGGGGRASAGGPYLERFAVPGGERLTVIDVRAVDWVEAARDYVSLHVGRKTHLLRASLTALERRLDPRRFLRVHRSAIVQLDRIRQLQLDAHGDYVAVLDGGDRVRVGRSYRDALLRRLGRSW